MKNPDSHRKQRVSRLRGLFTAAMCGVLCAGAAHADDLTNICRASTSYDITLKPDALVFQRGAPSARTLAFSQGALRVDGRAIALDTEDQHRIALIERDARALAPKFKAIASRAVDLGAQAVQAEVASYAPQAASDSRFTQALGAHVRGLKARIAASVSTREWEGDNVNRIVDSAAADLAPIVMDDAASQALGALTGGSLPIAGALAQGPAGLQAELETRVRQRLSVLTPDVRALCPTLEEIDRLQNGVTARIPGGPLDIVSIAR